MGSTWAVLGLSGALASGPLTCLSAGDDEPEATRSARQIWMSDCVRCHGATGRGDGEEAAGLSPPVPDFGDPCRSRSGARIERVILRGAEGLPGNAAMQPHHQLADAPDVPPRHPPVRERKTVPTAWLELVLTEGRNRQVRRMTAAVGHPTLRLVRAAIGAVELRGLAPGAWCLLPPANVKALLSSRASHAEGGPA